MIKQAQTTLFTGEIFHQLLFYVFLIPFILITIQAHARLVISECQPLHDFY